MQEPFFWWMTFWQFCSKSVFEQLKSAFILLNVLKKCAWACVSYTGLKSPIHRTVVNWNQKLSNNANEKYTVLMQSITFVASLW